MAERKGAQEGDDEGKGGHEEEAMLEEAGNKEKHPC